MNKEFIAFCEVLTEAIKSAYEEGITLDEAEKLAGKFLYAQIETSKELQRADLDARMRKSGTKAVKAAIYMEHATATDKKPSDVMLQAQVDRNDLVIGEQQRLDEAEVDRDALQNYMNIFKEAHIHFRSISKGRFE